MSGALAERFVVRAEAPWGHEVHEGVELVVVVGHDGPRQPVAEERFDPPGTHVGLMRTACCQKQRESKAEENVALPENHFALRGSQSLGGKLCRSQRQRQSAKHRNLPWTRFV